MKTRTAIHRTALASALIVTAGLGLAQAQQYQPMQPGFTSPDLVGRPGFGEGGQIGGAVGPGQITQGGPVIARVPQDPGQAGGYGWTGPMQQGQAMFDPTIQMQALRANRLAELDRGYANWRGEQLAEMDQAYQNWRANVVNRLDQVYLNQRNEELAALDRAYAAQRGGALMGTIPNVDPAGQLTVDDRPYVPDLQ